MLKNISNVSDSQIGVKDKLESGRRFIEVEFVLTGPEAEQSMSTATIATVHRSIPESVTIKNNLIVNC